MIIWPMNILLEKAVDPRQFPQWGEYLKKIGWTVEKIDQLQVFIRKMPIAGQSMIKIQHPIGPIPFGKIEKLAKKYKAVAVVIEPHLYKYDEESYKKAGFRPSKLFFSNTATVKIDLTQPEDSLFHSFSENARRNIRKSQKNDLELKTVFYKSDKDNKAVREFYLLQKNLQKMKKFYAPPYGEQLKKIQAFKNSSYICFAYEKQSIRQVEDPRKGAQDKTARSKQQKANPIAAVWYAFHKDVVFYVQTGIMERGYDLLANYLLVWEGMQIAKKLGIKVFDFESIYDPRFPGESKRWKKYSEFKKRFHGEIVEYPRPWIKFYKRWFKYLYIMSNMFGK